MDISTLPPLTFEYTNYRNETSIRKAIPTRIWHGRTKYHPEHQWLLTAFDVDKKAYRDFAMIDIVIVRKQYFDGLKMSKQEIKDEMKNMDGDPLIKAKIKQKQMEISRKRMMAEVPNADVVITNPTHYAVAIKYDEEKSSAPIVVAKGMDNIAQKIKEIARENGVHIVQNPPLARSLYAQVEVDKPIPNELFAAVAEVLAYVFKMNKK